MTNVSRKVPGWRTINCADRFTRYIFPHRNQIMWTGIIVGIGNETERFQRSPIGLNDIYFVAYVEKTKITTETEK